MIMKAILFVIGIVLISISISFLIIYIILLNMGYTFSENVNFITRTLEIIAFILGVCLVIISMVKRKENML